MPAEPQSQRVPTIDKETSLHNTAISVAPGAEGPKITFNFELSSHIIANYIYLINHNFCIY